MPTVNTSADTFLSAADAVRQLDERQYVYLTGLSEKQKQYAFLMRRSPRGRHSKTSLDNALRLMNCNEKQSFQRQASEYVARRINILKRRGNFEHVKTMCTQTMSKTTQNVGTQTPTRNTRVSKREQQAVNRTSIVMMFVVSMSIGVWLANSHTFKKNP